MNSREEERIAMLSDTVTNLSIALEIKYVESIDQALDATKDELTKARTELGAAN